MALYYSGIEQKELLASVCEALSLLETHVTGPLMQARIDGWLRNPDHALSGFSQLEHILRASDEDELADAVNKSGVKELFGRFAPVIRYHALNDTDGTGLSTFKDLQKWSALEGPAAGALMPDALDDEANAWLFVRYVRKIAAYGEDPTHALENYKNSTSGYSELNLLE